ncbi:Hcp family type VI secretion system effector [Pseudomonas sp. KFB-139]|uniref:Hcp family type VI secretion system effector n=1 Tax=Pseudomonas serbiensis TaxID=3064350 RepID=A0ABT9CPF6_9PSED|nr:Hcp family type VI secretion system effector [Pseudomonas sp. KFB-138]MDO7927019.1 Hcp family type VI secretion system effector [Pseudomonas sp. KFB-138]
MAIPAYMTITGTRQGLITENASTSESVGNIYQENHEHEIMVQAMSHVVTVPSDPQSGQPTGQRVHKPLCITKVFDRSSPLLHAALSAGETLSKVEIHWYRINDGIQENYYVTTLEDAIIVEIKDYMHNCQDPASKHFTHLQDVHFTYRKITWTHISAHSLGSDDWRAPVKA